MCGINGFFNYSGQVLFDQETAMRRMNAILRHRGPDDHGIWSSRDRRVWLGHQRLSILDLSQNGHQPMQGANGNVIVYNGEIYNFKSLRRQFDESTFRSASDTEVLLCMYERDGIDCLTALNGMYAFAIWDEKRRELILARDRIGIKPLYYTTLHGVFAFSSEVKALLILPWVKAHLDESALYNFLTFNHLEPPQTMFQDIYKFHPGYTMTVGEQGLREYAPYWEVTYTDYSLATFEELRQRVQEEMQASVRLQMVSDVPVGAFLSGGVDSSAVVSLMSRCTSRPVKTYSIGFENAPNYDELKYARKVAKHFGTEHTEKVVKPLEIVDFLPRVVDVYDEPLADATSIPIYFLSQLARKNGTIVVLTGDGADELFCGYRHWMWYAKLYPWYRTYALLPRCVRSALASLCGTVRYSSPAYEILSRAEKGQEFYWGAGGFKESTKRRFLSREYIERMTTKDAYENVFKQRRLLDSLAKNGRKLTDVDWLCFRGLKDAVPNYYLYRADHIGMAHSIEIRVPFLDHHVVDFALSIGGEWKICDRQPKYILKKAFEQLVPPEILFRKKMGFCVPLHEWAGEIIVSYVDSHLEKFCSDTGLFDASGLRELVHETRSGSGNYIFSLWNIYFLMSWMRRWIL
jgi:asparagine synthase (glutamine-hydrolysing)